MEYNEIIIPRSSIENSDSENIAQAGPMKGYTTSFEIPNGTMEHWKRLPICLPVIGASVR